MTILCYFKTHTMATVGDVDDLYCCPGCGDPYEGSPRYFYGSPALYSDDPNVCFAKFCVVINNFIIGTHMIQTIQCRNIGPAIGRRFRFGYCPICGWNPNHNIMCLVFSMFLKFLKTSPDIDPTPLQHAVAILINDTMTFFDQELIQAEHRVIIRRMMPIVDSPEYIVAKALIDAQKV